MKIAFVGKGGSGKTTLSSLFARHLADRGLPVVAIDADINQHLGVALGLDEEESADLPAMGAHLDEIKGYLRGDNPRITSTDAMVKTTPPGRGSRLLRLPTSPAGTAGGTAGDTDTTHPTDPADDPIHAALSRQVNGVRLMVTGPFGEDDLGVACYHSKVGAVELYLNHLVDGPDEHVVVDMTAGAESFASGMFTRFDLTFLVAEPTRKGAGVYRQYTRYAADHEVAIAVVGNKVHGSDDVAFLRAEVGTDLLGWFVHDPAVRAMERGRRVELDAFEPHNLGALERLRAAVDERPKDWPTFTRQAVELHLKNARSWASRAAGEDLTAQVDPDFVMGPEALMAAV